jgi:hypothetical protein
MIKLFYSIKFEKNTLNSVLALHTRKNRYEYEVQELIEYKHSDVVFFFFFFF